MSRPVMLLDLDETLILEGASATASFLASCEIARARRSIAPDALHRAVLQHARTLWRAAPTISYCQKLGIASWEALWSEFPGDAPQLTTLREWMPTYRHETWSRALSDCGVRDSSLADELAEAFFRRERPTRHVTFPDAEPTLRVLQQTHRLGLITNGPSDIQRMKLKASGLEPYFTAVAVSTEVGAGKPDPRIFAHILSALSAEPADAVMVGDSLERDIAGAQTAGIAAVWLNRTGGPCPDEFRPDREITTLTQLI